MTFLLRKLYKRKYSIEFHLSIIKGGPLNFKIPVVHNVSRSKHRLLYIWRENFKRNRSYIVQIIKCEVLILSRFSNFQGSYTLPTNHCKSNHSSERKKYCRTSRYCHWSWSRYGLFYIWMEKHN